MIKKIISLTSHALDPPSPCHKLSHLLVPTPPSSVTYFIDGPFYSESSSPLLLRVAPETARILCRSFTSKCHRQLREKDLPKVPRWPLERDSNPRSFGRKAPSLPMSHHVPQCCHVLIKRHHMQIINISYQAPSYANYQYRAKYLASLYTYAC